ncbi:hypothetical protein [Caballeronia insecticola]|uniref:hypothetical protein n=1 Tax=Caballeronia insecticola TaxID=758793 RepID=UPI0005C4DE30|nr:hypothetical protein [Caballeronia insecticola]
MIALMLTCAAMRRMRIRAHDDLTLRAFIDFAVRFAHIAVIAHVVVAHIEQQAVLRMQRAARAIDPSSTTVGIDSHRVAFTVRPQAT